MASTSASTVQKSFKYDVFLSFRGEDTRKNFVDHLYHALTQKGIYTYRDDEEIKKGERISDELIRSIEDSNFYIIVFSKNYASSSWCLDELVKIMECQEMNEHTAYPVFYDVEPTEVRKQIGAVEEAFSKHKEKENAEKWREALREAAHLAGWELKKTFDGHESKLIQQIVKEISLELRFINSSLDEKLVGMETRVKKVLSSLEIDLDKVVRMIGIWGMGGAGKTTLARAVFDEISYRFEGSSFVENVRENSKHQLVGLKSLQKQVLSDVLNDPHITVKGVSDMKRMMRGRKVLVVLDDVDHRDQLEALAGAPSWFKSGSRVIITTREKQVLVAHDVPENLILGADLFSDEEANCLFNKYAFGRVIPNQGYEKLSEQVVRYAAGLPLTIKILGSFLPGKDELEWIDALARLKTIPLTETLDKLELSYESLEYDQKEIFLDVACILKGWKKEKAIIVLESCGFHARIGLRVLEHKCLITVSLDGRLGMHDRIEEMGKHIVRRLHPYEPHKHSRLWIEEEIEDILVKDKGTEAINCMTIFLDNLSVAMNGLQKMGKLRFLCLDYGIAGEYPECDDMNEDKTCLPNGLRYLSLKYYPFTCFPDANFQPDNLVGLEIKYSNLKHWEVGEKVTKNLRFIELYDCELKSLNIGLNMNIERLHLEICAHLVELHMPVESLKLKSLNLSSCKLKTLNLTGARNLETLELIDCEDLVELHMPNEKFKLKSFFVNHSKLRTLDISWAQNLDSLNVCVCLHLVYLQMPLEGLKFRSLDLCCVKLKTLNLKGCRNLETLDLEQCVDLAELHIPVESLNLNRICIRHTKLKTLNLKGCRNLETLDLEQCEDLVELHMPSESLNLNRICIRHTKLKILNLKGTQNLETLDLEQYEDLVELHMPDESSKLKSINICRSKLRTLDLAHTWNLRTLIVKKCEDLVELHLPVESLELKRISLQYCFMLKTIYFGLTPNLKRLDVEDCNNLVEIHAPVGSLKQLVRIKLSGCIRFKPFLVNPWFPDFGSSAELHLIARSLDMCPLHPDNNFPKFQFECNYKERMPLSTGNLEKLLSFGLCACTDLVSFSESICGLQCLGKLTLAGSIPDVPKNLDQLECLEKLYLSSTTIKHLPDNICLLKHLTVLRLKSCWLLEQLPEDLGSLECLEELYLTECILLRDIPNSICEMKSLKYFHLPDCFLVEKLPEEMGRLKCLKELKIEGTGISHLPPSTFQLTGLRILGFMWQLKLYGFTSVTQISKYMGFCYI